MQLEEGVEYQLVNAKRSRGGIVPRERLRGSAIRVRNQHRIESGDFLMSRRQIIHGACGLVPRNLVGAIVSNEYAILRPREGLLAEYLGQLSHTRYFQRTCFHSSLGVDVEKMVFNLEKWLNYPVSVPSRDEQMRVVQVLEAEDAAIKAGEDVVAHLDLMRSELLEDLLRNGLPRHRNGSRASGVGPIPDAWSVCRLGEVLDRIEAGWSPECEPREARGAEWGVLKVSAVSSGQFKDNENKALPADKSARPELEVKTGDVLVARASGALDLVGVASLVAETRPRLMLSDKTLRLVPKAGRLLSAFLWVLMGWSAVRNQIIGTTTGSHMRNISQDALKKLLVAIPTMDEQVVIAEAVEAVSRTAGRQLAVLTERRRLKATLADALLTGMIRVPGANGV